MKRGRPLALAVSALLLVAFPLLANPISTGPQAMEGDLAGYDSSGIITEPLNSSAWFPG